MKQLTVYDFLVLEAIQAYPGQSIRWLHGYVNKLIALRGMSADYACERQYKISLEVSLHKLHEAGLLSAERCVVPANAAQLWAVIGTDWHRWPYYLPFANESLHFDQRRER